MLGVVDERRELRTLGYRFIVITDQSGIARGLSTASAYPALTVRLKDALREHGVTLAQIRTSGTAASPNTAWAASTAPASA